MMPVIEAEGLCKQFGRNEVLRPVSFEVPQGAIYALVGANGAGKTTMIKVLMNILTPTAGGARVLGMDSRRIAGKAFERIGYASENQELPEAMTVEWMLGYLRPFYPRWDRGLEHDLLRQFELPVDRKLKHLSRGMRMKVAFVAALAFRPELLVLDEPFSGLDPLVRDELIESLLERAPETTIFLSSHDLAEIESFSSHVGYLEKGRLVFSEEMSVLSDRFREVTVTLPAPTALPAKMPATWLQPETADCVVRFVESRYSEDETGWQLAQMFPAARDVSYEPMPLRSIFLALARTGRVERRLEA